VGSSEGYSLGCFQPKSAHQNLMRDFRIGTAARAPIGSKNVYDCVPDVGAAISKFMIE